MPSALAVGTRVEQSGEFLPRASRAGRRHPEGLADSLHRLPQAAEDLQVFIPRRNRPLLLQGEFRITLQVTAVDNLLAAQANPENPDEVNVSQPSSALTAQADAQSAFNVLFLGLGAVALLVGTVGVANIMVISVLERRSEIGLRRALGATKCQIRTQFLSEAILLSLLGGSAGILLGGAATAIHATSKGWAIVIPALAWAGGLGAALLIGAAAGLLPALKAARLSPTQALWTL